jgi:hypothetical protein
VKVYLQILQNVSIFVCVVSQKRSLPNRTSTMAAMAAAGTLRRMRGCGSVGQAWRIRRHAQDGTESFVQMYLRTRPALFGNSLKGKTGRRESALVLVLGS